MNVSKLLMRLLTRFYAVGVVEEGAAVVEEPAAQTEDEEVDPAEAEGADASADAAEGDEPAEGVVISLGDDTSSTEGEEEGFADEDGEAVKGLSPEQLRAFVRMRRQKAELKRKLKAEQAKQEAAAASAAPVAINIGPKPTLAECDYDEEKLAEKLDVWYTKKAEADAQQRAKEDERKRNEEAQRASWQATIDRFNTAKAKLRLADYEDAQGLVEDTLSIVQQGIILQGAEKPELLVYALGRNPKKAKELASITDPVKFAIAVGKLETQLKVTPRKAAPTPDTPIRSSVAGAAAVDNQLARLQAEADKTGDRSKVAAYLRQKNRAKQAA